jgi:plasmid stability protein
VTFRLDEEEYQGLRDRSAAHGARSISDYTRSILCRWIGSHSESSRETLEAEVGELRREVERLARLVEGNTPVGLTERGELNSVR